MTQTSPLTTLRIDGLHCGSCVARAQAALAATEGIGEVAVNLATHTAVFRAADAGAMTRAHDSLAQAGYPARSVQTTLTVAGMSCASCVGRIERILAALPGVLEARANLATGTASVRHLPDVIDAVTLAQTLSAGGYKAQAPNAATPQAEPEAAEAEQAEAGAARARVLVAAILTLPVVALEMGGHLVPALHALVGGTIGHRGSWVVQAALTALVLAGPGREFFSRGMPALVRGAPDMNSLVALGAGAAFLYSAVATFLPSLLPEAARAVYFEAAAVIVTLILVGRLLEARARGRAGAAIRALVGLRPPTARVLRDGVAVDIPAGEVAVGDLLVLRPGERLAVDGIVAEGTSFLDESMISGEPAPVARHPGDEVTGGTVNGSGGLTVRATRVGSDTVLARIIRMVEEAQGARLPIQALVDRITLWFVPAVLGVAALTVAAWLFLGPDPALPFALVAGVSVLIIACPCAMGLATPVSILVGTGRGAELGVLFRKGSALQALDGVRAVVFDKTGTLTEGRPDLTDLLPAPGLSRADVLAFAAAVEARSEHPVASAILRAAEAEGLSPGEATEIAATPGEGIAGEVAGQRVLIGSARMMAREGVEFGPLAERAGELAARGRTAILVAAGGRPAGVIAVSDPVKPGSRAAIAGLRARGLVVALMSGDRAATARAVARDLGIDRVEADLLPGDKLAALRTLRADLGPVAFVGDGINDAPALAGADVGIALGSGTDVAIESAEAVLMSGDPRGVVTAIDLSRRTMANIRQNLAFAFVYNVALIPVAAGALYPATGLLLSPVLAAAAMALSSVSVVANALRLRGIAPAMTQARIRRAPRGGAAARPIARPEEGRP